MPIYNRNWKAKTWAKFQSLVHKMTKDVKESLPCDWCAWWVETDPITNMSSRHYRDFPTEADAKQFAVENEYQPTYYANIKTLPWHHRHAHIY